MVGLKFMNLIYFNMVFLQKIKWLCGGKYHDKKTGCDYWYCGEIPSYINDKYCLLIKYMSLRYYDVKIFFVLIKVCINFIKKWYKK